LLAKAAEDERAGRWSDAVQTLRQLVQQNADANLFLRDASALEEAGDHATAEQAIRDAIELEPNSASAYVRLAILFDDQDRLVEAVQALEEGTRHQQDVDALVLLASALRRLGRLTEARERFEQVLELDPLNDEAHYGLGLVLRKSDPPTALMHLLKAAELDPTLQGLSRELGLALWRVKEFDRAEAALRAAIDQDPTDGWAHDYLGHLLLRKRQVAAAKAEFAAAVQSDPGVGAFWANLAEATASLGDVSSADQLFKEALSRDAGDPYTNLKYGLFLKSRGHGTHAVFYLERVLSLDPDDRRAREALKQLRSS
jgi:tetratricopeptide (TPR) repeat protein